jgi:hypothetical protein
VDSTDRRDEFVHHLGNLTLATAKLNPTLGNADWVTKKTWLTSHSLFLITTTTILTPPPGIETVDWPDRWHEDSIEARGEYLARQAVAAWPHR